MSYTLHCGDCLDVLPTLPAQSFDAVIADPPYGTTACKWDSVIPLDTMWRELKRVIKPRGAIVLFGAQPFTTTLIASNQEWFKYEWIWNKGKGGNFQLANVVPMRYHENVVVFGNGGIVYYPIMTERDNPKDYSNCDHSSLGHSKNGMNHFGSKNTDVCRKIRIDRFPGSILDFPSQSGECNNVNRLHPTQKPVDLLRYLVRTYTNAGETVLDFTMGSGTTGVACEMEGRNFVGIELDAGYFDIAKRRIEQVQPSLAMASD